ncbi:hypothetical protein HanIR_Chr10g0455941 [Helianthus annuus]|nr:hypothetical protein HanIR_Chr10g0455941 [Helianthus annuus]
MRQRELLEFRSPQHLSSSLGTNNWGGSSPLLARDIPKESLEQSYINFTTTRTHDEIFPTHQHMFTNLPKDQSHSHSHSHSQSQTHKPFRKGFLLKMIWPDKENKAPDAKPKKRRWLPKLDPKGRWPQGW